MLLELCPVVLAPERATFGKKLKRCRESHAHQAHNEQLRIQSGYDEGVKLLPMENPPAH